MRHPAHPNVAQGERLTSVLTGGVLAAAGLRRRTHFGWILAALGGFLVYRGATGHCDVYQALGIRSTDRHGRTTVPYQDGIRVEDSVTVNKPREQVYRFWRTLENLSRFMRHVESVRAAGGLRSHWIVVGPADSRIEWDAEIFNEVENELLAWRTLPGASVDHVGTVLFKDAPRGQGTEILVKLHYAPVGGKLGALVAKLWGEEPSQQVREDLHRLKQVLEAGEILTTAGQPSGRTPESGAAVHASKGGRETDRVEVASEESFPASDAPAWRA
jgi:uncharacterized membrane protein